MLWEILYSHFVLLICWSAKQKRAFVIKRYTKRYTEITKSRLMCLDWLLWWNICKLNWEGDIISFLGYLLDKSQTPGNCTHSWQLRYKWKYSLFYVIGCQNLKILKIFPLNVMNTFYFYEDNKTIFRQFTVGTKHVLYLTIEYLNYVLFSLTRLE